MYGFGFRKDIAIHLYIMFTSSECGGGGLKGVVGLMHFHDVVFLDS